MLKLMISSLHLLVQTLKQQHSSSECICTTIESFSDQGIVTTCPDICTASPRNPELGIAYNLHNSPGSLPHSKLPLITLRARTFVQGLIGTGSSPQQAPSHIHVSMCITSWISIHSYITRM